MHNQNVVAWGHRIPFLHSSKPRYQKTIKLFLVKKLQFSIYFIYNFYLLHQCDFNSFENHVCFVLKNLKLVNHRFFSLASKSIEDLPRIYLNNPGVLPKTKKRKICCEYHEFDKKVWILQWYSSRYQTYVKFLWLELPLASPTTMPTL